MSAPIKIAAIPLDSCCGCHMSLVNLGTDLLDILSQNALVYAPVIMDQKSFQQCTVALVEGGVRNKENAEKLKELREKADILIALGTCASFGGISGMGSAFSTSSLLANAYGAEFVPEGLPELEPRVTPIDAHVEVDYYIPGCPPPAGILRDTLVSLLSGQKPRRVDLPVCAECKRTVKKHLQAEIKRMADNLPDPEECLLSQGFICLGSVSRCGCGAVCTHAGVPCKGCRGPIDRVFVEPTHGIIHDLTRRISHFTGEKVSDVEARLKDNLHTFYRYTLSVPEMRGKDSEHIHKLIYRIKV
jgi:F420-non-reducing hydrogenase small subunit